MILPLSMSMAEVEKASDEDVVAAYVADGCSQDAAQFMLDSLRGRLGATYID